MTEEETKCDTCKHFQPCPEVRHCYSFVARLSAQEGRHVELGWCMRWKKPSGPVADKDWCDEHHRKEAP